MQCNDFLEEKITFFRGKLERFFGNIVRRLLARRSPTSSQLAGPEIFRHHSVVRNGTRAVPADARDLRGSWRKIFAETPAYFPTPIRARQIDGGMRRGVP
jgi:hypothetical protein